MGSPADGDPAQSSFRVRDESSCDAVSPPLSVVIPVHNGAEWLERVLAAIRAAPYDGPIEIIAVEDGSTDNSPRILEAYARAGELTRVAGPRRGAAAALNAGIAAATHPLIAQIDQDVVIAPDWLERLVAPLQDPSVAAAQGHYVAAADAGPWSRVMALDLRERYSQLGPWTNHVCTGNSIYRKSALLAVGMFDETLGYGYDNDMSYRLVAAGYRLAFCPEAVSTHYWREGLASYARQQYGFGYGRLDLVAKHRRRVTGDDVSRTMMMLHAGVMAGAIGLLLIAAALAVSGRSPAIPLIAALAAIATLALERLVVGARAARAFGDSAGFWFAPAHLTRDVAWAAAIGMWTARRVLNVQRRPSESMRPRPPSST